MQRVKEGEEESKLLRVCSQDWPVVGCSGIGMSGGGGGFHLMSGFPASTLIL